jgi:hypothetical protein
MYQPPYQKPPENNVAKGFSMGLGIILAVFVVMFVLCGGGCALFTFSFIKNGEARQERYRQEMLDRMRKDAARKAAESGQGTQSPQGFQTSGAGFP